MRIHRGIGRMLVAGVAAAALLPGCGGGGQSSKSPLDEALAYVPPGSPFVVSVSTDLKSGQYKSLESLARKFPFSGQAITGLRRQLESGGASYDKDIKPLLGNPAVVSAIDVRSFRQKDSRRDFVAALKTKDADKLAALVKKDKGVSRGDYKGAKLYRSGDTAYATKGSVIVLAEDEGVVKQALDRREGDHGFPREKLDSALSGLPGTALARAYFDVQALINGDPDAAQARKVKWVRALRSFGATLSADRRGLAIDFKLSTDAGSLQDADLPLAPGTQAVALPARVSGSPEVAVGVRSLGHLLDFCKATAAAIGQGSCDIAAQLRRRIGSRLARQLDRDLIDQLGGGLAGLVGFDGSFAFRTAVADPGRLERTLAAVSNPAALGGTGRPRLEPPRRRGGLYTFTSRDGNRAAVGLIRDVFVVADSPRSAASIATAKTTSAAGPAGSLALATSAESAAREAIKRSGASGLGALGSSLFTAPLGELTMGASIDTSALRGRIRLGID